MKLKNVTLSVLLLAGLYARAEQPGPELVIGTGHSLVRRVAFSTSNDLLATGSTDGTVKLWDLTLLHSGLPGEELRTINAGIGSVEAITFSGDGRRLATATLGEKRLRVWDTATGGRVVEIDAYRLVALDEHGTQAATVDLQSPSTVSVWNEHRPTKRLDTQITPVTALRFSPNGLLIISGRDQTAVWNVMTGKRVRTFQGRLIGTNTDATLIGLAGKEVTVARVDKDDILGRLPTSAERLAILDEKRMITVACDSRDDKAPMTVVRSWNGWAQTSERDTQGCFGNLGAIELSPDGSLMSWGPIYADRIEDSASGKELFSLLGNVSGVTSAAFVGHTEDLALLSSGFDGSVLLWKLAGMTKVSDLRPQTKPGGGRLTVVAASPDQRYMVIADSRGGGVQLRDTAVPGASRTVAPSRYALSSISFSTDGHYLAVGTFGAVHTSGESNDVLTIYELPEGTEIRHFEGRSSADFVNGGTEVAISGMDQEVILWDIATKRELPHPAEMLGRALFSPDGRFLLSRPVGNRLELWEISDNSRRYLAPEYRPQIYAFSPDSKYVAAAGEQADRTYSITIWDVVSGKQTSSFRAHRSSVMSLSFSPDGQLLASASMDRTVKLWAIPNGEERATLVRAADGEWVVSTPAGRWDAFDPHSRLLHWVVGNESIALNQLQESYFDPGLLGKIAGTNLEPLRPVAELRKLEFFPVISEATIRPDGTLTIRLQKRKGGVGTVSVLVNGVECQRETPNIQDGQNTTITLPVANCPQIRPGDTNDIKVIASNGEGNAQTRETRLEFTAPGAKLEAPRKLYAIIAGVSTYASTNLKLAFGAKDAEDIASAVKVFARRYFNGQVDLHVFASAEAAHLPAVTRANLQVAFQDVANHSTPQDVLLVFLAGHGDTVSASSQNRPMYFYFTADAGSADVLTPRSSKAVVSGEDLVSWLRAVPALGRIIVLNTCGAGGLSSDLVIDQLSSKQNLFALMGAAETELGFESSFYRQSLLTYALLQGAKGGAIDNDGYIDAFGWLHYATVNVPDLAARDQRRHEQTPFVTVPYARRLIIAEPTVEDRNDIPLFVVRRQFVRPTIIDRDEGWDKLDLAGQMDKLFIEAARHASTATTPEYVNGIASPGALRPQGTYESRNGRIFARVKLVRDQSVVVGPEITEDADSLAELARKLADAIQTEIPKLRF